MVLSVEVCASRAKKQKSLFSQNIRRHLQRMFLTFPALCAWFLAGRVQVAAEQVNVVLIMGTRSDVIRLAPVMSAVRTSFVDGVKLSIFSPLENMELLKPELNLFKLTPNVHIDLMSYTSNGTTILVTRAIESISSALRQMSPLPRIVIVQGYSSIAFAGATASFYLSIPVVHVGASGFKGGVEEFNRRAIGAIAALSLVPTDSAKENLLKIGVRLGSIKVTGSTAIDSVSLIKNDGTPPEYEFARSVFSRLVSERGELRRLVIVTSHRRDISDSKLQRIFQSVRVLAAEYPDTVFLYVDHIDAPARGPAGDLLRGIQNVVVAAEAIIPYSLYLSLLSNAALVVTDSGDVLEEAAFLGARCMLLRCEHEVTLCCLLHTKQASVLVNLC